MRVSSGKYAGSKRGAQAGEATCAKASRHSAREEILRHVQRRQLRQRAQEGWQRAVQRVGLQRQRAQRAQPRKRVRYNPVQDVAAQQPAACTASAQRMARRAARTHSDVRLLRLPRLRGSVPVRTLSDTSLRARRVSSRMKRSGTQVARTASSGCSAPTSRSGGSRSSRSESAPCGVATAASAHGVADELVRVAHSCVTAPLASQVTPVKEQ